MSDFPNMSHCMNHNTLEAMRQVFNAMNDGGTTFINGLSSAERRAFDELFNICQDFVSLSEELVGEIDNEDNHEYNDSMDGDFDSAMASAGHGTDEDYGGGTYEDY